MTYGLGSGSQLLSFSLVTSPCCVAPFLSRMPSCMLFYRKCNFEELCPGFSPPTLVEPYKSSQPTQEISQQTRSDRLWRKLIFSDTWHWDPLTSTQHNRRAANGERAPKASDKEARGKPVIRLRQEAGLLPKRVSQCRKPGQINKRYFWARQVYAASYQGASPFSLALTV